MCFSANASFAASGVLSLVGAASLREAKGAREKMYAAVPLIFAFQQLIEGFEWLAFGAGAWSVPLAYAFLSIAVVFWPVYIPIAVYLIEPQTGKKKRLGWFVMFGVIIAAYSVVNFFVNRIAITGAPCCHIDYAINMPFQLAIGACYVVVTCGSMLFSSHGWIRMMGAAATVALIATFLYANVAAISVWCFFAAILSALIFVHFRAAPGFGRKLLIIYQRKKKAINSKKIYEKDR